MLTSHQLSPVLALLLVHDLLLTKSGIDLYPTHGLRVTAERNRVTLSAELRRACVRRGAATIDLLRDQVNAGAVAKNGGHAHPRWVRVNSLKTTVEHQKTTTFAAYSKVSTLEELIPGTKTYLRDKHVPNLLAFPCGTDFTKTTAYKNGSIILQDKASCFPAYLLDPDYHTIDACAAPGNKTSHIAAILREKNQRVRITAYEKDETRYAVLKKMMALYYDQTHRDQIHLRCDDFHIAGDISKDKEDKYLSWVNASHILLDPSCSGSGIIGRDSMPVLHLPASPGDRRAKNRTSSDIDSGRRHKTLARSHSRGPGAQDGAAAHRSQKRQRLGSVANSSEDVAMEASSSGSDRLKKQLEDERLLIIKDDATEVVDSHEELRRRLKSLADFQVGMLVKAFGFINVRRVTYSTCSVHPEENEHVVVRALDSDMAKLRNWRLVPRQEQVEGMREWPVRGQKEAFGGDEEAADACIRTYPNDGRGTMGFFVAAFECSHLLKEDEETYPSLHTRDEN
jgi:25S rRNA (cytosine2278-C5)-methyltransferase